MVGFFLLSVASAQGAVKSIWGPVRLTNGQSAFPYYKSLHAEDLQLTLDWSQVATRRPDTPRDPADAAYVWPASIEEAVAAGRRDGVAVSLMVLRTPSWANGNRSSEWAPTRPGDYADFVAAAAQRYPSVHRWMIWGEPNRRGQFRPEPKMSRVGPRRYAQILDAAYGALKQVSRRNVVIGGMTYTAGDVPPRWWLRWLRLPSGRPPRLDWWGHNPFSTRFPDLAKKPYVRGFLDFSDVDTLHNLLRRVYHRSVHLWLSEFTIQSDHGSNAFNYFVSRRDQARWLTRAYSIANRTSWIAGLGWTSLTDQSGVGPDTANWGLLTATLRKKPAYYAYRRVP